MVREWSLVLYFNITILMASFNAFSLNLYNKTKITRWLEDFARDENSILLIGYAHS